MSGIIRSLLAIASLSRDLKYNNYVQKDITFRTSFVGKGRECKKLFQEQLTYCQQSPYKGLK